MLVELIAGELNDSAISFVSSRPLHVRVFCMSQPFMPFASHAGIIAASVGGRVGDRVHES